MRRGIIAAAAAAAPAVSCAYPLDDDGSLAGAFGYAFAGPAVGADSQSMDYTAATTTGVTAILAPAALFSTARFSRPDTGYAVAEAAVTVKTNPVVGNGQGMLLFVISDAAGNLVNVGTGICETADGLGVLAVKVAADGTVTGYLDDVVGSISWFNPAPGGQTTVGATDKFGFALAADGNTQEGDRIAMTLRTAASDITGSYGAGGADPCGNSL